MAKIVTESIVITFSKIVKDNDSGTSITSPDIQAALEQVAQELIGDSVVVEVVKSIMSQTTTLILLPQTAYVNPGNGAPYTVTGNSQPGASYIISPKSLQTVNINLTNCTGNITIEASLATTPSSTDWFKVYELEANANAASNSAPQIASNASVYTNINGNFVYMRAKVVDFQGGLVNFVKLSY